MPGRTDDDQLENDSEEETEETEETTETEESTEETTDEADDPKKTTSDKRIRDLQSKADAETARANKAEAALKNLKQGGSGSGSDPATQALMAELREASLDAVYGEFPVLRDYGIDRSLIEGTTRTELRGNAASLVGLIKSVETKARNKVLAENGLSAPSTGGKVQKPVDYASMSDEAFEKLLKSI
jgi:hypothetical protein